MVTKTKRFARGIPKLFEKILTVFAMILSFLLFGGSSRLLAQTTDPFNTAGANTWTCPAGVDKITIECWGGGGAGGGATGSSSSAGGGGAGGGYVKTVDYPVTPGVTYNLFVGAGGTGNSTSVNPGQDSWFGSATTIKAVGGNGGARSTSSSSGATGGPAVSSGNLGFTAPFSYYGGAGGQVANGSAGGGGGSSAGTGSNGNPASGSTFGAAVAGGGAGVSGSGSGADGADNTNLGGGGAGARATSFTDRAGGNGGKGKVTITYTQLTYKSQILSVNTGGTTWCAGETRNVIVQVKNIGTATWTDASPDINIGIKWNTNGTSWADYYVRVDAGNLAPGATGTYTIPVRAMNYTQAAGYTTNLTAGTNNLTVDVVYEGLSWFGNNGGGVGPGNTVFTTPAQTIVNAPAATPASSVSLCQGSSSVSLSYTGASGSPTKYSIDFNAAAEAAGMVDIVNATLPASPITVSLPTSVPAGSYVGAFSVSNANGCSSAATNVTFVINPTPAISLGANPTVCRGTVSSLISYTATNANQYSIDFNAAANTAGFADVTNATLSGGNISIVIPAAVAPGVYSATVTPRNSTSGCTGTAVAITVTVQAPTVSITGATTICQDNTTTLSPTSGGTWVSNTPAVASVANDGTVTGLTGGTSTFTFTETATGCSSTTSAVTVNANSTLSRTSAANTDAQTVCRNSSITNITYLVGGGGTGASVTGLPAGVNFSYNAGTKVLTIAGSPSVAGSFAYTVTTSGPCINTSLGGTIDVTEIATISRTSAAGTDAQVICIDNAMTDLTYAIGGNTTGGSLSAGSLPAGVSGVYNAGVFTISGTPTASGSFNFTVRADGACPATLSGSLLVNANSTIALTSSAATTTQTVCVNSAITNITYQLGAGATGATVSGLPAGVTGSYNSTSKVYTISGSPSATGSFSYTVTTTGPCINNQMSGSIDVTANATISRSSAAGTDAQTVCVNAPISNITYVVGGSGTGGSVSGLPSGVTGSYAAGVITITGTPTVAGSFNYTVSTAGPCVTPSAAGSIIVNALPTSLSVTPSTATICTGNTQALAATANIVALTTVASENFNGTPAVTVSGSSSNSSGQVWSKENNGSSVNGVQAFTSPNGGGIEVAMTAITSCLSFSGCSANANTTMTSSPFNTTNLTSATISWAHAYKQGASGSSGKVEISLDNTNWTTLKTYTANAGTASAFASDNVTLSAAYLNKTGVRIRFVFVSNVTAGFFGTANAWWAVDDLLINGNVPANFSWSANTSSPANGLPSGAETASSANANISVNPTATTEYTLTAVNPITGCSSSSLLSTITVNPNSTISLSAGSNTQTICSGGSISPIKYIVGGSGTGALISGLPASFQGSFAGGEFIITGGSSASPGTYNYTVTTTGPCVQAQASGTITVSAPMNATAAVNNVSACSSSPDGSITITTTGGTAPYNFSWSGLVGSGNPSTTPYTGGTNSSTVANLQYGFYNVTVTDVTGCSTTLSNIHVKKAYLPYIVTDGSISSTCAPTGTLIVYAQAGVAPYTYSIDGTNYQSSGTFTNLAPGSFTVYAKDAGGCISSKPYTVNQALPITINPYVTATSSCSNDGKIQVYRSGGIPPYTYSLNGISYQVSNQFSDLAPGSYTVHVKDSKGCDFTSNVNLPQGTGITVSASKTNVSACINDGSIQFVGSGGVPPYTYSINGVNFQSSNSFTNLAPGTYTGTVKDFKGCTGTLNVTLNVTNITIDPFVINASACDIADGTINVYRTGGYGPYSYSLDGNFYQVSNSFTSLAAGTYDVYVKDSRTCVAVMYGVQVGPAECVMTRTTAKSANNTSNDQLTISAYPNPSHSSFNLQFKQNQAVNIEVRDVLGKLVYQSGTVRKTNLSIGSDWMPGVYFVKLTTGDQTKTIRLVKE
jgi:hypothetical protein